MSNFKETPAKEGIIRISDGAFIPQDPDNLDYQNFLASKEVPLPADPVPPTPVQPSIPDILEALEKANIRVTAKPQGVNSDGTRKIG